MTDTTPNLALPEIVAAQAQKHVTHNEALRALDALVQLAVLDRDLASPPGSPDEGQRWLVAASPSGAWVGHAHHIAAWQDGGWEFYVPQTGWLAYVVDEGALIAWSGSAWADALSVLTSLNNMTLLGVGTTADATNPFSLKLNNTLFTAKTVAEGGDGNLRYKLSKESAAKTLSFLFQDNFSGRAEIGLTGDDDFHFKVSSDGTSWLDALTIDRTSGKIALGQGVTSQLNTRGQLYAAPFDALAQCGMQINGAMEISQFNGANALALTTGAEANVIDGWNAKFARAATLAVSAQQVSSPAAPAGLQFALQLKATTGLATLAAGDYAYLSAPIEGYRVSRLALGGASAQSISIGFWVYATIAGTMAVTLTNSANNRSFVTNVAVNNATTWEYKTVTVAGDTAGAWLTTTGVGLRVIFCFGAGSTFQGPAGAWQAGQIFGSSATTNFMASTNNVAIIAGVVVLPGVELPAADRGALLFRPFPQELALAQRYYEKSYDYNDLPAAAATNGCALFQQTSSATFSATTMPVLFKASKRAAPAVTLYSPVTGATGKYRDFVASADNAASAGFIGTSGFTIQALAFSATTSPNLGAHWAAAALL